MNSNPESEPIPPAAIRSLNRFAAIKARIIITGFTSEDQEGARLAILDIVSRGEWETFLRSQSDHRLKEAYEQLRNELLKPQERDWIHYLNDWQSAVHTEQPEHAEE